jgi:hypothetical protein
MIHQDNFITNKNNNINMKTTFLVTLIFGLSLFTYNFSYKSTSLSYVSMGSVHVSLAQGNGEEGGEKSWWQGVLDYFSSDDSDNNVYSQTHEGTRISIENAYNVKMTIYNAEGDSMVLEADSIGKLQYEVDSTNWEIGYPDFGNISSLLKSL